MFRFLALTTLFFSTLAFSGCVTGKYVSSPNSEISQAPMKLRMCHKVRWTYYAYTNSGAVLYYEDGKYSKKNDTIYIHSRKEHLDKEKMVKVLEPAFVVSGDSLTSLDWGFVYVKAKTLK